MGYRWPTDGPSALPKHSISWSQEVANRKAKGIGTVPNWTGGAPIPITSAPTAATPQPPDPGFELAKLTAGRNVALGNSEAAYETGGLGFDAGYNPDGSINTANPYSRAAMLQLGYENQQRGTTNSLANAGQLYAGSLINQRGIDSGNYARSEAANRLGYQRGLHAIQYGQLSNQANNSLGVGQGDFETLLRAAYPS
jgi:hypothetical protein